jgi:transposase
VVIGMDSHKRSATIDVMACNEAVLHGGWYGTNASGYRAMRRSQERTWVVEGCQGIGRHIATLLIADGEHVVDVPPKLSARTRVPATGQGRKTDAHSVAFAATWMTGLANAPVGRVLVIRRFAAEWAAQSNSCMGTGPGLARHWRTQVELPQVMRGY